MAAVEAARLYLSAYKLPRLRVDEFLRVVQGDECKVVKKIFF